MAHKPIKHRAEYGKAAVTGPADRKSASGTAGPDPQTERHLQNSRNVHRRGLTRLCPHQTNHIHHIKMEDNTNHIHHTKMGDKTIQDLITPSEQNTFRSREEAVKRARQKRLENMVGNTYDERRIQSRSQSRSASGQNSAERATRTATGSPLSPQAKSTRRQARAAQKDPVRKKTPAQRKTAARSPRPHTATGKRSGTRRGSAGSSASSRSSRSSRLSVPFVLAILLLLCVLFIFPGIVPKIILWNSKTHGKDTTPPVIELNSDPDYVVYPGQEYEEEGYTASDDRDGDLTEKVSRTAGDDRICYRVSDEAGNSTVRYRQIPYAEVSSNIQNGYSSAEELAKMRESFPEADSGAAGSGKIVYLTFDDGPGQYTERLLDILERNDVHVTFFVTGGFPDYEDLIKKEYEAGHSIGIHTFTHDFDKIYKDEEAFWKDIGKMQEVVVRQTGHATNLMRFAGGSSNTMGTWQTPGIMGLLSKQAPKKGFQYFDWNVSSGDGAMEGDSAMVISRITEQIQNYDESVVLCHDTKEYTVNAMEYLIPWLLDKGYTILPLSPDSEPAHHSIQN